MSASEFIFIYDIPNHYSPLTLMLDISNTYAKMTYFDSPDFKGNRQAFVFYPEMQPAQWDKAMEKLRAKEPVKASYVWFPDDDGDYIEDVPEGVTVLPYIYIENLSKDVDFHQLVFGLPHIVNLRFMDVPYKDDKWALIYLGPKVDPQTRRNVVMGLRSKSFNGYQVYASELLSTECSEFPRNEAETAEMPKPNIAEITPIGNSFRSEFLFLSNVPQPLGHGKILHFIKARGVKLARVFFIETVDYLKRGFLHLPALSQEDWDQTVAALRSHFFHVSGLPDGCGERIDVEEVWFQPHQAAPPVEEAGMILTDYYFVYNVPRGVSEQLLVHGCGLNRVRIQLFDPTTLEARPTKIGFAVRLSTAPDRQSVEDALASIRGKRFGDSVVFVDRIWRCLEPGGQKSRVRLALPGPEIVREGDETMELPRQEICLALRPPVPFLSKVPLLFLHGLPVSLPDADLLEEIQVCRSAGMARPTSEIRFLFVQPSYLDRHSWSCALTAFYVRILQSKMGAEVNEVFKEDGAFDGEIPEGMVRSCFLLVSNLPLDTTVPDVLEDVPNVEEGRFLLPNASTEQHLVVLLTTFQEGEVNAVISALRDKCFSGRRPNVSRLWLSTVETQGLWPSFRAPCQANDDEEDAIRVETMDDENGDYLEISDDSNHAHISPAGDEAANMVEETNGQVVPVLRRRQFLGAPIPPPCCVVVDGLPLLTTDKTVLDIMVPHLNEQHHIFCVITSPSAQSNRLIIFAASPAEAQSLLREVAPPLKKHFRHRALLTRTNGADSPEDLIPVSEDLAQMMGARCLLIYGLPRLAASNVRSQLRQILDPASCTLELKWAGKRFLGHVVLSCPDWETCSAAFKQLQHQKFGNSDVKVKFLSK